MKYLNIKNFKKLLYKRSPRQSMMLAIIIGILFMASIMVVYVTVEDKISVIRSIEDLETLHSIELMAMNEIVGQDGYEIETSLTEGSNSEQKQEQESEYELDEENIITEKNDESFKRMIQDTSDGSPDETVDMVEQSPYDVISSEFELLKQKDNITVERYFGNSNVFTADAVANKLAATVISFVSTTVEEETSKTVVTIHICTLDYNLMKDKTSKLKAEYEAANNNETSDESSDYAKKEVAKGIVEGEFDVHYNIPVTLENNLVIITEELKQALTGNWYSGVNTVLTPVECPLNKVETE